MVKVADPPVVPFASKLTSGFVNQTTAFKHANLLCSVTTAFQWWCDLRSVRSLIHKDVGQEDSEEFVKAIRECISHPDLLTICKLGAGGSEADIDVAILSALMKGTQVI